MLKHLIEKELREIIGSTKFALSFGVCSFLIILAFVVGGTNHLTSVERYRASQRENLKQLEGLTDWAMARNLRIFLSPRPLTSLVSGVSNDIGRTTEVQGRGDLPQVDSRYNEEPVFAVFRFLDLEFIFQIVLSLFAILFAYDAITGEKERGTLRLTFANPLPRHVYITGKFLGSFFALALPLLVPILCGALLLPLMGVSLTADEWARLALIVAAGILYFAAFLSASLAVSAFTSRSSTSFLLLLVVWTFAVLIVPRSAVLIAGRAVAVPSVDEIAAKKSTFNRQLWTEDRKRIATFQAPQGSPEKMMQAFQKFMSEIAEEREKRMTDFSARLNEERANRQGMQEALAFGIARISPSATFSLAATALAGSSLRMQGEYREAARGYQETYRKFILGKTGVNVGGGMVFRMVTDDGVPPKPIDPAELPPFTFEPPRLGEVAAQAFPEMGLLAILSFVFFGIAHAGFRRYDLR